MSHAASLPPSIAALVALLVLLGAALALIGSWGLLRLDGFFNRVHPPTMGTTMGVGLVSAASMLLFSALESRAVVHEAVIVAFMIATTPVTFMLLFRGAMRRDRALAVDPAAESENGAPVRRRASTPSGRERPRG